MPEAPCAAAFSGERIAIEFEDVAEGEFVEELDKVGREKALLAELEAKEFVLENREIHGFH